MNRNRKKSLSRNLINRYAAIITVIFLVLFIGFLMIYNHYIFRDIKNDFSGIYYPMMRRSQEFDKEYILKVYEEHIMSKGILYYNKTVYKYAETSGLMIPSGNEITSNNLPSRIRSFIQNGTMLITVDLPPEEGNGIFFVNFNMGNYLKETSIGTIFFLTIIYLLGIYSAAMAGLLIYGSRQTKKALKPIKDLTVLAENINENSMSLRLDVNDVEDELKDLCITFNNMLDRIQQAYDRQRLFLSDASHELRTPISIIDGYANMLKRWGKADEKILDESIEAIAAETINMKQITNGLLFLSSSDANTIIYEMTYFNLSDVLSDIIRETLILDKNRHTLKEEIVEGLVLNGDCNRIKQCIRILIDNAMKYTPEQSEIIISAYDENDCVAISVSDYGPGIKKEDLGKIFNRFYRGDVSRDRSVGVGLGLSIAREIVLKHKGTITVTTKDETGTTFKVNLPTGQ
ncbi:MAG: HAMP domain-containing histidine kinase [Clostridia bacterium]|nr:HAMP domain-containing histidine kinase [Clostridia bacterium]MBN2883669.1 HAMP domain-containing histidine kinase [Clostridia bacterium]